VLLQKTLLNVEGLGRQLDPELDLWKTAKPHLERWMSEQLGWRGLIQQLKIEMPRYSKLLPQLPRLAHQALSQVVEPKVEQNNELMWRLIAEQRQTNHFLGMLVYVGGGLVSGVLLTLLYLRFGHVISW
jgi:ubiquinone biosynthesis protein